jgi:hypothetical protein
MQAAFFNRCLIVTLLLLLLLLAENWEAAQKVARGYLSEDELHSFYSKRARTCEANRQWNDAERAYVAGGEVDMAVAMHKRNKAWLAMLKLVQQHRREQLPQAHLMVAQVRQWCSCCLVHVVVLGL